MHVPLVIRIPGAGAGTRIDTRVRLADVAPSLLEAAGVPVPSAMQGQSLMPLISQKPAAPKPRSGEGGPSSDRPVYSETEYPRRAFGWSPLAAWRNDRFLLVRAPKPELYDLVADPSATNNLAATRPRVLDGMSAELREFLVRSSGPVEPASPTLGATSPSEGGPKLGGARASEAGDPELAKRLAALGYVSGGSHTNRTGVDPKDRIAIANALHQAVVAVEDGAFQKAIPLLEKVTASEPDIPLAQLQLGVARARQRQYTRAIPALRKAIALQPDTMIAHYELGVALYEAGDLKAAAGELEIVAAK